MADVPYDLNAAEREEEERRKRLKRPPLEEEIARKYDTNRLSKMVLEGAGRGERLDLATRSTMERVLPGHDFSKVRVFRGPLAEEVTARHKADAVTVANTGMVLVRENARSAPGTRAYTALLAHELTHVAQAQRGMHFAKPDGPGEGSHEAEAEAVEQLVSADSFVAPPGGDSDGSQQGGKENEKSKKEHRRRKVVERVLEMLGDIRRQHRDRQGKTW